MTPVFNVLIVDDEPIARDVMASYITKVPSFKVAASCGSALDAFAFLSKQKADLMLLDINMPEVNGMDFLRTLKDPPLVIFTTAYSQFAAESYDLNAVDYLLKPVSFERFETGMNKALKILSPDTATDQSLQGKASKEQELFVRSDGKWIKIELAKLWFVEGLKDYIRLWTDEGRITVHSTMKSFEEQLSAFPNFIRVHKSHIVNMQHVSEVEGSMIRIKDQQLAVGNTYKEAFQKLFGEYR